MAAKNIVNVTIPSLAGVASSTLLLIGSDGTLFNTGVTTGSSILTYPPAQYIFTAANYTALRFEYSSGVQTGIVGATLDVYKIRQPGTAGSGQPICMDTGGSSLRITLQATAQTSAQEVVVGGTIAGPTKDNTPYNWFILPYFITTAPSPSSPTQLTIQGWQAEVVGRNNV